MWDPNIEIIAWCIAGAGFVIYLFRGDFSEAVCGMAVGVGLFLPSLSILVALLFGRDVVATLTLAKGADSALLGLLVGLGYTFFLWGAVGLLVLALRRARFWRRDLHE